MLFIWVTKGHYYDIRGWKYTMEKINCKFGRGGVGGGWKGLQSIVKLKIVEWVIDKNIGVLNPKILGRWRRGGAETKFKITFFERIFNCQHWQGRVRKSLRKTCGWIDLRPHSLMHYCNNVLNKFAMLLLEQQWCSCEAFGLRRKRSETRFTVSPLRFQKLVISCFQVSK